MRKHFAWIQQDSVTSPTQGSFARAKLILLVLSERTTKRSPRTVETSFGTQIRK
jgi:hypothetical protein